jgi:RNA polymerase sigma factor (sigma-70 family)
MLEKDATESAPSPALVAKLVANHREFLAFLERRVGNRAEAEDLLQQALVKGLEQSGSVRDDESVVAWFYRSLRNAVVDHHRRRGAAGRTLEVFARELSAEAPASDVQEAVCSCVKELAQTLKPEYAQALQRVELEGMSVQGYAAEIGTTANNAGVRLHRARAALRQRVKAACGTCAEHGCIDCTCKKHVPTPSAQSTPE